MIKYGSRLGYICRRVALDGKTTFKYREGMVTAVRLGKAGTRVYSKEFMPQDLEDIGDNTDIVASKDGLILVNEVFETNDDLAERCQKWCEYANEHGA